jgi:hypothetical protein
MMQIGRTVNSSASSNIAAITLNSTTSTVLAVANENRIHFEVSLDPGIGDADIFIKLQPASTDNDKKGIPLVRNTTGNDTLFEPRWVMPSDNIYTGEISAISEENTPIAQVTEF